MTHHTLGDYAVILGEVVLVAAAVALLAVALFAMFSVLNIHPQVAARRYYLAARDRVVRRYPGLAAAKRQARRDLFRKRIRFDEPCPACGHVKRHVIKWNPSENLVVHICAVCEAHFGQSPARKVDEWQKKASVNE